MLYAALVLTATGIELRFNLVKRFRQHKTDIFGRLVKPLTLWSLALCAGAWLTLLNLTPGENLLTARLGQGHWFVWLTLIAVVTRWGWDDLPSGMAAAGVLGGIDELAWFGGYLSVYPASTLGWDSVAYVFLLCCFLAAYFLLSRRESIKRIPRDRLLLCILVAVSFHAMWALAGFHVSNGTPFDYSVGTALLEDLSWVMPGATLL